MEPLAARGGGSPPPAGATRPVANLPACGGHASSPSGWRTGWSGTSWTSSYTDGTACTWRSSPPAWPQSAGIRQATGTPCSRTSRGRGPATPSPGMILSAPSRGMRSATSRASGQGHRWASGGHRTLSRNWSGGHGHWPGCRGQRQCHGRSCPWTTRPLSQCGAGAPGLPGSPSAGYAPTARGAGPNATQRGRAGRAPPSGGHTAMRPGAVSLPLLPLGGRVCAGLTAHPFFAARHEVMLQLMRLATHCRDTWVRPADAGPYTAATGRPFSHGLLPAPPRGGGGGAAPAVRQEAPTGAAQERSARGSAAQPPARSGQRH